MAFGLFGHRVVYFPADMMASPSESATTPLTLKEPTTESSAATTRAESDADAENTPDAEAEE